jgi:cell division protein FtsI/penicillin-binding protein 2
LFNVINIALNSLEESRENKFLEKLQIKDDESISQIDTVNNWKKSHTFTKLPKLSRFFYIMAKSDLLDIKQRLQFRRMNKCVSREYPHSKLLTDYLGFLKQIIPKSEKEIKLFILSHHVSDENLLKTRFKLSKTAQNCLNFLTKQEEDELLQLFNQNKSEIPALLISIIKIIYILINYDYTNIPNNMLLDNIYTNIFKQFNVDRLSKSYFI